MAEDEQAEEKNIIDPETELKLLQEILVALQQLDTGARIKLVRTIVAYFEMSPSDLIGPGFDVNARAHLSAAGSAMSPRKFMEDKQPQSDAERIVCLAYYLTHYFEKPQFKTADLTRLNQDAAQRKFASAAKAVDNAIKLGYLKSASGKGVRQLSDTGELFVKVLPDRTAIPQLSPVAGSKYKAKSVNSKK